jgi:hypothetical protein
MLVTTSIFFILSTVPIYLGKTLKATSSVDVAKFIVKIMKIAVFVSFLLLSISTVVCTFLLENFWATIIHLFWLVSATTFTYKTFEAAQKCYKKLLEFHDFLVDFRQTPRGRLLRRHLPPMEAVVEEQSVYEVS